MNDAAKAVEGYHADPDKAAREWQAGQGDRWAGRNPTTLEEMDLSFIKRYGCAKSWAARDALRQVPREHSWLEVGCATGVHMLLMERLGFRHVWGTDIAFGGLPTAPSGMVVQSDALRLPFATRSVDGITTAGSFMHLGPATRMRESLREMDRVARRWLFFAELRTPEPSVVHFGDLLPPVWLYPWEQVIPATLENRWRVVYHEVREIVSGKMVGKSAPLSFTLFGRSA